ncbi:MAG: BTAD domain-containing putative transcriptional regulator [Anaerolineae bacterium]|jgi:PAS domain S-box-containing protein
MREFLSLFGSTGDGAWAVDADQRIILWNKAAEELLGYTAEEALGQFCYELLAGRDLGGQPVCRAQCAIDQWARDGRPIRAFHRRVRCGDGQMAWIDVSGLVVPDESRDEGYGALVHLFRLVEDAGTSVPPLRIRLLGPVVVQRADGSPVGGAFRRRAKVRTLFALLVLHRGQAIRRERLLATLWPDKTRQAALHNLHTTVYHVRHSLEPDLEQGPESAYIQIRGNRYRLVGGRSHWLDVDVFENKLAAVDGVDSPGRAERLYRQAIALYRGDFLADLDVYQLDCWTERARYRQLYLDGLQGLGDLLQAQNRDEEAIELYRKVLAEEPCREVAARELMRLALQDGERSKALSQYARLEENLERELDVEPTPQTRRLQQEARAQDQ